jgi:hypothetical protein
VLAVPTLICFHCRKHVGHLRYENVFRCLRAATLPRWQASPGASIHDEAATLVDMSLRRAAGSGWANTEGGARP